MARKKGAQQLTVTLPPDDEDDDPPTPDEAEAERVLSEVDEEVSTRTDCRLYRQHPSLGSREQVCDVFDANQFSLDYVRQNYGGGVYRAEFIGPIKRGKSGKPGRGTLRVKRFEIDLTIPPKHPQQVLGKPASPVVMNPDGTVAGSSSSSRIDAILEGGVLQLFQAMQNVQQTQASIMERALKGPEGPRIDWTAVLPALVGAVPELVRLFTARPDPMQTAREIADLATRRTGGTLADDMKSMLALMREMQGLSNGDGSDASGDTPILRTWERVAAPILELLARRSSGPESSPPSFVSGGQPEALTLAPAPAVVSSPSEGVEGMTPLTMMLRKVAPLLAAYAEQGRDVEWVTDGVLYDVPPGLHPTLAGLLADPSVVGEIQKAFPALLPYGGWLEELRGALVRAILEPDDDDDDSDPLDHAAAETDTAPGGIALAGRRGDAADARANARPSTGKRQRSSGA